MHKLKRKLDRDYLILKRDLERQMKMNLAFLEALPEIERDFLKFEEHIVETYFSPFP